MPTTTLAPERPRLDVAAGDLVLRISGSPHNGQIVRLRSPKCTIGSGSQLHAAAPGKRRGRGPLPDPPQPDGGDRPLLVGRHPAQPAAFHRRSAFPRRPTQHRVDRVGGPKRRRCDAVGGSRAGRGTFLLIPRGNPNPSNLPPDMPHGKPSETPVAAERNALAEQRRQWQAEQEEAQRRGTKNASSSPPDRPSGKRSETFWPLIRTLWRMSGTPWPNNGDSGRPNKKRPSGAGTQNAAVRRPTGRVGSQPKRLGR